MTRTESKAESYRNELQKQTDPYAYFLRHAERKERGRSITVDGPLPCHLLPPIPGLVAESVTVPDIKTTYVILKTGAVGLYDDANRKLISEGLAVSAASSAPAVIYCDHDYQNRDGKRHTPYLKPDYSPHTLLSVNYMGEYVAIEEGLLGGILRALSLQETVPDVPAGDVIHAVLLEAILKTDKIAHVTETLFYLQSDEEDAQLYRTYANGEASAFLKERIGKTMENLGIVPQKDYSLSVIIPSKDHADILIKCIESLKNKTSFAALREREILVIDNGSYDMQKDRIESYIRENEALSIRYLYREEPFNYSLMCDRGAKEAKGDLLLFLNDDVEFVEDTLPQMCMYALSPLAGTVGCKLLFPDRQLIQHAGVTGLLCGPTHKLSHHPDDQTYYFGANTLNRNTLAVTGACLMVKREKYFQVQGFHDKMTVSYNDVDLCVNLYEKGYFNILLNTCILLHHESLSRGSDLLDQAKTERLAAERACFYARHEWLRNKPDPFYHPDLIQDTLDYRVNVAADYEMRGHMSGVEVFECHSLRKSDKLQLTVEGTDYEPDQLDRAEDAYVIRGWSLYLKHDERNFDRFLLLEDEEGRVLKVSLMPVFRQDVQAVFAKQKYAALAGFIAKIPATWLHLEKKYRVALMYVHKTLRYKITTVGAYYEPGKGYESES